MKLSKQHLAEIRRDTKLLAKIRRKYLFGEAWLILLGIDKPKGKKRKK